jgi:uncharacterized protein (DUF934 family)
MRFVDPRNDRWHLVTGEDGPVPNPSPQPNRLLTLEQWHAVRDEWPQDLALGLLVPNSADVHALAPDLHRIALVVLEFPKWTDGRAYSQARLLRTRHRYTGELRATGQVLVDMLPLLQRTGFDAVELRADQDPADARRALRFFAAHYQADPLQRQPVFGPAA